MQPPVQLRIRLPFPARSTIGAPFHLTALHCTALHCTALHCTALHCTALHCGECRKEPAGLKHSHTPSGGFPPEGLPGDTPGGRVCSTVTTLCFPNPISNTNRQTHSCPPLVLCWCWPPTYSRRGGAAWGGRINIQFGVSLQALVATQCSAVQCSAVQCSAVQCSVVPEAPARNTTDRYSY
jgi:hypothetical protein